MPAAEIMMQSSASDKCASVYIMKILNLFNPEFQLINTKLIIKKNQSLAGGAEKL